MSSVAFDIMLSRSSTSVQPVQIYFVNCHSTISFIKYNLRLASTASLGKELLLGSSFGFKQSSGDLESSFDKFFAINTTTWKYNSSVVA